VIVLIVVVLVGALLFVEGVRKMIVDSGSGSRGLQRVKDDPKGAFVETL